MMTHERSGGPSALASWSLKVQNVGASQGKARLVLGASQGVACRALELYSRECKAVQEFTGCRLQDMELYLYFRKSKAVPRSFTGCRLQGMELYSTVLWHLKKEVELSHLAQEAIALDRLDPRSWCIMGNCFSLQKVPCITGMSRGNSLITKGNVILCTLDAQWLTISFASKCSLFRSPTCLILPSLSSLGVLPTLPDISGMHMLPHTPVSHLSPGPMHREHCSSLDLFKSHQFGCWCARHLRPRTVLLCFHKCSISLKTTPPMLLCIVKHALRSTHSAAYMRRQGRLFHDCGKEGSSMTAARRLGYDGDTSLRSPIWLLRRTRMQP